MDIQRKCFEESNNVNPVDWSFKFDEELQQYIALDSEMGLQVDEFNEHWDTFRSGWRAAKAQAVPDLGELQERIAGHQHYHDERGHMIVDMDDVVKEISGFDSWKAQAVPEWISVKDKLPPNDPYNREYWVYETLNNKVQHDYWVCPDTGLDQDFEPFFNNWSRTVTHWMPMVKYPDPPMKAQEPANESE